MTSLTVAVSTRPAPDDVLRRAAIFQGVLERDLASLSARADLLQFERGQHVFSQGVLTKPYLYVVVSGKIKLVAINGAHAVVVAVLGTADEFGELSLFDPVPHTVSAVTLRQSEICRIPGEVLSEWASDQPSVGVSLLQMLAQRLRRADSTLADIVFVDVYGRLAKQLLDFASRFGTTVGRQTWVQHDLSQDELAQLVGSSRETVNKGLSDFAKRGWIRVEPGSVAILQPDRLGRRARCGR